ncbi:MAG: 50S ribosomal protein L11 methyltransferase [Cytophagales bacterium]|nr:50S ribosomal protein L11 methyltransferase [Cytophagales bacterium]
MQYLSVHITYEGDHAEILSAYLWHIGCESVWEKDDNTIVGYMTQNINEELLKTEALTLFTFVSNIEIFKVDNINWNEEWEKNFNPITIFERLHIRAPFHTKPSTNMMDIVIAPKMSFGTGHHETTSLMMEQILRMNLANKKVLDAGTGTGILGIVASKSGATYVAAIDTDPQCIENATENIKINQCENIHIQLGNVSEIAVNYTFDIILANITKNILLQEATYYKRYLANDGTIVLSGFYTDDENEIINAYNNINLSVTQKFSKNNWSCLVMSIR